MWENLGRTFAESFHMERSSAAAAFVRAGGAVRRDRPRRTFRGLRPAPGELGDRGAGRQAHGGAADRRLPAPEQPLCRRGDLQAARAALRGRAPAEDPGDGARASAQGARRGLSGVPRRSARRPWRGGALLRTLPRCRTSFRRCSRARPACRSTPAPPFGCPNVRFRIRIEPVPIPQTNDREADALAATAALQAQFEAFIREAPEQWMWGHRRWD